MDFEMMSRGVACLFSKTLKFLAVQIPQQIQGNKVVVTLNCGRLETVVEPKKASVTEPCYVGSKLDAHTCDNHICFVKV